jgi:hypothetical protein
MRFLTITPHARIGPVLFVLLGFACAYLGCWLPLWRDRSYPAEFDTRVGFIVGGFAPMTTGSAVLAVYGYIRLWRLQCTSPTPIGQAMLLLLLFPLLGSVVTGIYLAPAAVLLLPSFLSSIFESIAELFGLWRGLI